jgi:hypothetical protein
MKKRVTACLLAMLITQPGFTAGERIPAGGRSMAMGGTSVSVADPWSVCNNQAGTAWASGASTGISFENRFLLKELMFEQAGFILPVKAGTFGILASRFGDSQFNELKAGISFARKVGKHFSVGVQLDYLRVHVAGDYGNKSLVSCELGLLYVAGDHLGVGVQLLNPVPVKITMQPVELLPSTLCIGLSYLFSDDFLTTAEVEKDLENPPSFRCGAEYHVARPAWIRIGLATSPVLFTFGFGLDIGKFRIDMASGYHQALGFSPSGSITYSFD